jgi:hypothetical protein
MTTDREELTLPALALPLLIYGACALGLTTAIAFRIIIL